VSGGMSDRGSEPGQNFPQYSMAELDKWAELAGAGDRAFASTGPAADGDAESMSYEELCQAHIEAFMQVSKICIQAMANAAQPYDITKYQ
jgi:hypothetical protein